MTQVFGSMTSLSPERVAVVHRCDECRELVVGTRSTDSGHALSASEASLRGAFNATNREIAWIPKTVLGKAFPDIPEYIASPASESFMCHSIGAYRAAVLLARAVIEASAKEKGVTDGTLFQKIDKLAEGQHIRQKLAEAAHEVRLAGNGMAHGDFATEEITEVDAEELLSLMEDFLTEMFELDTRVQRRKDRRMGVE